MRANWTGFYGPSYRLMLKFSDKEFLPDEIWNNVVEMHKNNPTIEGHWEFLALGYLILFDNSKELSEVGKIRLKSILVNFNKKHPATNWRFISQIVKRRIEGGMISMIDIDHIRLIQTKDGFLEDIPEDNSSQYHAFLLFLLMRFSSPNDSFIRSKVVRSFDWLTTCYKLYGDPSPLGRGRFQLFGYASMVAAASQSNRWKVPISKNWLTVVWSRLSFESLSGSISPYWNGPHRSKILHGYNTIDDYPAFVSLMTHKMSPKNNEIESKNNNKLWWHPLDSFGSGILADHSGIRLLIITSKLDAISFSRKKILLNFLDRKKTALIPSLIKSDLEIPNRNIRITFEDGKIIIFSDLNKSKISESRFIIWSTYQPLSLKVSGSVETAKVNWKYANEKLWEGFDFRIVRRGEVEVVWER